MRDVADGVLRLGGGRGDLGVANDHGAGIGFEDPGDHGDRGGLPSAVRTEQAVRLAGRYGEADVVYGHELIERLAQSLTARTEVSPATVAFRMPEEQAIQHNHQIVNEHFHLQEYGMRLLDIYRTVLESEIEPADPIDAAILLEQFLAPERFCLLRT